MASSISPSIAPGSDDSILKNQPSVVGAELNILAGSVEHLAGTTFSHLRIAVPPGTDPQAVIAALRAQGADARLTRPEELEARR